jgi:hypothetical protein
LIAGSSPARSQAACNPSYISHVIPSLRTTDALEAGWPRRAPEVL